MKTQKFRLARYLIAANGLLLLLVVAAVFLSNGSPHALLRNPTMLVDCVDNSDGPIGSFKINSLDQGMTASVESETNRTILSFLNRGFMSEEYGNDIGEKLVFDGEVWISNLFGDVTGVCR